MFGYRQDWASVEIGKVAVLELADENAESPEAGDIVKVNLRGSESDHIVTGKVVGKSSLCMWSSLRNNDRQALHG